jgi:hypothetical protein
MPSIRILQNYVPAVNAVAWPILNDNAILARYELSIGSVREMPLWVSGAVATLALPSTRPTREGRMATGIASYAPIEEANCPEFTDSL